MRIARNKIIKVPPIISIIRISVLPPDMVSNISLHSDSWQGAGRTITPTANVLIENNISNSAGMILMCFIF
jgi:hypothetical protein